MPDWDSVITPTDEQTPEQRPFYEGEVKKAPTLISDRCLVTLRAFDPDQEFECYWSPRLSSYGGLTKPVVGDTVLVITSDDEEHWIIDFIPSSDPTFVPGSSGLITTGTATPILSDLAPNSTYFQVDGSGNVIAEWVCADG